MLDGRAHLLILGSYTWRVDKILATLILVAKYGYLYDASSLRQLSMTDLGSLPNRADTYCTEFESGAEL